MGDIWGDEKKGNKYIGPAVDLIAELSRSMNNVTNDGIVNLLVINKIHAPSNWTKIDQRVLKTASHKSIQILV
jgi:hypothetical protein